MQKMYAQESNIPPLAAQAAQMRQLGSYVKGGVSAARKKESRAVTWVVYGIIIGLSSFLSLGTAAFRIWFFLAWILAAVCFYVGYQSQREYETQHRWNYILYRGGFVRCSSQTAEAYAWRDIVRVHEKITEYKRANSTTRSVYQAILYLRNGSSITFEDSIPGIFTPDTPISLTREIAYRCKQIAKRRQ